MSWSLEPYSAGGDRFFLMAELQREVRIRGGHRAAATRIINVVNVLLEAKPTAERRILLRQQLNALQRKLDTIQALDENILKLVNDEEI